MNAKNINAHSVFEPVPVYLFTKCKYRMGRQTNKLGKMTFLNTDTSFAMI